MNNKSSDGKIQVGDITINPGKNFYIAGPCAIESESQIFTIAEHVVKSGATLFRGGAYKPRTSPDSFQGLGTLGLELLFSAGNKFNVPVVTEVIDASQISTITSASKGHPFIFQIGSRNAQNYFLLKEVGKTGIPVLLKRGKGSTVDEMVLAAEYAKAGGSPVLMCERGITTFSSASGTGRFTADHIAILKFQEAGFITIFDPSHPAGKKEYVTPLALSGIALGANGLIIEVHNNPKAALCDKQQALELDDFKKLMEKVKNIEMALRNGKLYA
ncbi:MAG: 3-deoxy-7-phosphoheptulonate synthase [Candidatus Melainabacteria bacterium]|nr:3-deoxy-7-phosphoheptulonate synthase [Candidatus Melainabacteria bacterium]